jgi:DNA-binding response OmpR family regulator
MQRLLVVDDEAGVREAMKRYLERRGYAIDCAARAADAKALLAGVRYDAVITDLQLSAGEGAEGFAVVVEARRLCSGVRILLLTGQSSEAVAVAARRLGVDVLLHKPRPLPEIESILQGLLRGAA